MKTFYLHLMELLHTWHLDIAACFYRSCVGRAVYYFKLNLISFILLTCINLIIPLNKEHNR